METESLKTLAQKILRRNAEGNRKETPDFQDQGEREKEVSTDACEETESIALKIFSELLNDHLWLVPELSDIPLLRASGITEAIYTFGEIPYLRQLDREALRRIHEVKTVFTESFIESINPEKVHVLCNSNEPRMEPASVS